MFNKVGEEEDDDREIELTSQPERRPKFKFKWQERIHKRKEK